MAIVTMITCSKCLKHRQVTCASGELISTCDECRNTEIDRERREHFSGLDGLTIEERLRNIEEWIYNYRPYREPRY